MPLFKPGRPTKYHPAKKKGKKPPRKPGLYRIVDEEGKIKYYGETASLLDRMNQHIRSGKLRV